MEREACVCDHGYERSDLCAEIIIIIIIPIILVLSDVGLQACALSLMRLQAHVLRTDFQTSAKKIVHRNRTNTTSQDACSYRYEIPARSTLLAWNVWRAVKIPA